MVNGMTDYFDDFGFTTYDEEDLATDSKEKLDRIYALTSHIIKMLEKNPEKAYIHWPDRAEQVKNMKDKLTKIYKGE